jgi:phosphoribosyl 1,2-cyclic phosphodiesterase
MKVRFWGVRGSIPTPGKSTVNYGGNTSCIEIRGDKEELLIIDSGTGIRSLGKFILENDAKKGPLDIKILLTHTHWDHIQGFPFFEPAYLKDSKITFYGPVNFSDRLEDIIAGEFNYKYFPIKLEELRADLNFEELQESTFDIGGFHLTTTYMNHPILDLGYRIQYKDKTIVTMYDTEPYRNPFLDDMDLDNLDEFDKIVLAEAEDEMTKRLKKHKEHAMGADLLIYDSQYTEDEYTQKLGWGHSYIKYATDAAIDAGAKKLCLFHHDPLRNDVQVDEFEETARSLLKETGSDIKVFCARERLEVTL